MCNIILSGAILATNTDKGNLMVENTQVKDDKPIVITHTGIWILSEEIAIECFVTDKEERLMSLRGAGRAMNLVGGGGTAVYRNLNAQYIQPYLSDQLKEWATRASKQELSKISPTNGPDIIPIEASLFAEICLAYTKAHIAGKLTTRSQKAIADRLLFIMTSFMKVGLDVLIDEVTGYQKDREEDAVQKLIWKYVSPEIRVWKKVFDDEFFKQLYRLRGWKENEVMNHLRPSVVGTYIDDIVYDRFPKEVMNEIKQKVKKSEAGNKLSRYHQYLSEDTGLTHLEKHLVAVIAIMKISENWSHFLYMLDVAYPKVVGKKQSAFYFINDTFQIPA